MAEPRPQPGDTQGCSPHQRHPSSKGGNDTAAIPLQYLTACLQSNPLVFLPVHPGKTFNEQHKPLLAAELLDPVFPRLGTTCLAYLCNKVRWLAKAAPAIRAAGIAIPEWAAWVEPGY